MNEKQIKKDFSELYIGRNSKELVKEHYRKKYKEMFVIVIAGVGLVLLCFVKDIKNSLLEKGNILLRSETQEQEIILQIKNQDKNWEDVSIWLYPKEYSEEELEELFIEAVKLLPDLIQKEGSDLNQLTSDLNLAEEIEGYPFLIQWESSAPEVINEKGQLLVINEQYNGIVRLKAIFEYGEWKKDATIPVHVKTVSDNTFSVLLKEELEEQEAESRKNKEFYLPESFEGQDLQWRYPTQNSAPLLGIFLLILIPVIAWQKDREIHLLAIKRREQLQEVFPEFVAKMILLLEAGVSTRNAIFYITEDYQKKSHERKNYLYEELNYICKKMKNGLSEKEAYELLAKRCNISCYKKLFGMLIQHLQKGGSGILFELRNESLKAGEEEKRRVQKKGEEMGTKLLFPMMMMLGIVMIFIMVPALFSFQV